MDFFTRPGCISAYIFKENARRERDGKSVVGLISRIHENLCDQQNLRKVTCPYIDG